MLKSKVLPTMLALGLLALVLSSCTPGTPTSTPTSTPTTPLATTTPANFRFLVSDEPNDIGDFEHLYVTVSNIAVQLSSDNGTWLQFSPNFGPVDLIELQGKNAQEIWSGNVTPGKYNKVFIYVSDVEGILAKASGNATVKLPSGKLQISKPFTVSENSTTSFVFDITVIKAGKSGKYILKPQIAESGADKSFSEVKKSKEKEQEQERERARLQLRLEGDAQPGATVVLAVTAQGKPAQGANVTVNGQASGTTNATGEVTITIPVNAAEVKIVATLGQNSGKLELEFTSTSNETELAGTIAAINGTVWTVTVSGNVTVAVDVENAEIKGNPEVGSKVEIEGVDNNGVIVASEVRVREGNS